MDQHPALTVGRKHGQELDQNPEEVTISSQPGQQPPVSPAIIRSLWVQSLATCFFRPEWYQLYQRIWTQATEDSLTCWKLRVFSLHRHPCFQRSSTPTSELLKHACNHTALTFLCVRKSTVTSDSSRCGGLPEITLWVSGSLLQRKAQDRGQWQSWQSFKDSSLLSWPPHLAVSSVPSHLDLDQETEIY